MNKKNIIGLTISVILVVLAILNFRFSIFNFQLAFGPPLADKSAITSRLDGNPAGVELIKSPSILSVPTPLYLFCKWQILWN